MIVKFVYETRVNLHVDCSMHKPRVNLQKHFDFFFLFMVPQMKKKKRKDECAINHTRMKMTS